MKRLACLAALLPLMLAPVSGQVLFHDDFQSAGLNRFLAGDLGKGWTLYNDKNEPNTELSYIDSAWKVIRYETGDMFAASPSFFRVNGKADRWMITPAIDMGEARNPVLSFRAGALDLDHRDGFEVKISTEGIAKEQFKTLKSVSSGRNWIRYELDLSDYKGKTIHLAFVQNSQNQYMIGIDDVVVHDKSEVCAFLENFSIPYTILSDGDRTTAIAKAELFNAGSAAITSYRLCKRIDNGNIEKEEVTNKNIPAGDKLPLELAFELDETGFHTLSAWVENINGQDVSSPETETRILSADTRKTPKKNLLLEMFSSGTCSSCGPWNAALHPFFVAERVNTADNGGNFCVVKYQVDIPSPGDPCVTSQTLARKNFYGVGAAPTFYVNGKKSELSDTGTVMQGFRDAARSFHKTTVSNGLTAYVERENNTFKVHAEVTGYLPDPDDYDLVVCLIEDSIRHTRSMPNGETVFYHVVRQMLPSVTGITVAPESVGEVIKKDFEYTFDLQDPKIFSSVENMGAVVFLQNNKSKEVIQARYLAQGTKDSSIAVGDSSFLGTGSGDTVGNMNPDRTRQLRVYPNPASERCQIVFTSPARFQAGLQMIDMQGKTVSSRDIVLEEGENHIELDMQKLADGFYIIRIVSPQGVFVHKLVKR